MLNNLSVSLSIYPYLNENLWNKIGLFGLESIFYEYTANPFIEHTLFCSNSTNILDYDQTPFHDGAGYFIEEKIYCKNCNITLDQTNIPLHPIKAKLAKEIEVIKID